MDLSTLTQLSRSQLDAYARRAGVAHPEQRSTTELLTVLLNLGATQAERSLRSLPASTAAKVAASVLSSLTQSRLLKRLAPASTPPSATPAPMATSPSAHWRRPQPPIAPVPETAKPMTAPTSVLEAPVIKKNVPDMPVPVMAAEPSVAQPMVEAPHTPQTVAAVQTVVAVADTTPTRTFVEEPIRTRSLARVLALQGHRERAIAMLDSIVNEQPHDVDARGDLERLRAELPLDDVRALPEPQPLPALPETGDHIEITPLPDRALHIRWSTTEEGHARARAVLGAEGELALRLVAIAPDPTRVVRSDITERGPVASSHEWIAPAIEAGSRYFAAIGLRLGNRFVAIAHAPARTLA